MQPSITNSPIEDFIFGTIKSNGSRQYGYGIDVLRLWAASKDLINEKGEYINLLDQHLNNRVSELNVIRKCVRKMLGLLSDYQVPYHIDL